jgi:hypothetical protein
MLTNGRTAIEAFSLAIAEDAVLVGGSPAACWPPSNHVIHVDRALDVLEGALAKVGEADRYLVLHLLARRSGNADSAGFRQRFQPSRDVHAVAIDVIAFDDDVADIDADAENDAAFFR